MDELDTTWSVYFHSFDKKRIYTTTDKSSGDRLNIKMLSYQYRDIHVKDMMVSRPSHL